jgi:hypothetical protein
MTDYRQSRAYVRLTEALGDPHGPAEVDLLATLTAWLLDDDVTALAGMVRRVCARRGAHYRGLVVEVAERMEEWPPPAASSDLWVVVLPLGLAHRLIRAASGAVVE